MTRLTVRALGLLALALSLSPGQARAGIMTPPGCTPATSSASSSSPAP